MVEVKETLEGQIKVGIMTFNAVITLVIVASLYVIKDAEVAKEPVKLEGA